MNPSGKDQEGAAGSVKEDVNEVWNILNQYKLSLKQRQLKAKQLEIIKTCVPPSLNFVGISNNLIEDFLGNEENNELHWFWEFLRTLNVNIKLKTSEVYTSELTFKIDDTENACRVDKFMKAMKRSQDGPVGSFGQGINPGDAFKNAVNSLHAQYFGKPGN